MHPTVPPALYPQVRRLLLGRARKVVPGLRDELTAYTPREVLALLDHPEVKAWHRHHAAVRLVGDCPIVLVPCARRKPWAYQDNGSYGGYNRVRHEAREGLLPPCCFVTISEPLGVVPESLWNDFPQYDCPGLFTDRYLQSGLKDREWVEHFGQVYELSLDAGAWLASIDRLAAVLADFVRANPGRRWLACVDTRAASNVHGAIVREAVRQTGGAWQPAMHPRGRRGREARYQAVVQALAGRQT